MMGIIRVLLVDDHALVRGAVGESLQRERGIQVVGRAACADEALVKIAESRPDVVLMDIKMPGMICFDAAREIGRKYPQTKVVFLSGFMNDQQIQEALDVKAHGYLTKDEPTERVAEAIREVAAGGVCYSEEVRSRIVVDSNGARLPGALRSRLSTLRPRELEVLRYVARGMTKKEIAEQMAISIKTVECHTSRLMKSLNIHDRVELTRFAIREGLAEA